MSVLTTTSAESRRELAYRLHRFGLNGGGDEVPPSYRRAEEALRRAARVPLPKAEEAPQTLAAALAEPLDTRDMTWFTRREQAGEAAEVEAAEVELEGRARRRLVAHCGASTGGRGAKGASPSGVVLKVKLTRLAHV